MSELSLPNHSSSPSRRNVAVAGAVVLFHVAALWALQSGLLRRVAEIVVPVQVFSEIVTPPAPKVEPPPEVKPPEPVREPVVQHKPIAPPPPPKLAAAPQLPPALNAPTGTVEPQPAPPPIEAPVAVTPAPPAPPAAPAKVELPSSSADYLQNPKPVYPPVSKRLGEQGKVVLRVLIGVDGTALDAEFKEKSGYDRLDQAAMETVRKWRYVPGKRGGVPEAMWFNVPIHFVLE